LLRPAAISLLVAILLPALGFGVARNLQTGRVVIVQAGSAAGPTFSGQQPAVIDLSSATIPQGGAFSVRVHSSRLVAGSASFRGRDYPMVSNGDLWYAIVGAGQEVGTEDMIPAGDYPVRVQYQFDGSRDVLTAGLSVRVAPVDFPVDAIQFTSETAALLSPDLEASEAVQMTQAYSGFTPRQLWSGAFVPPVNGEITTNFGSRRAYQGGPVSGSHSGVDLGVPSGTPVGASAAGRVAWTGTVPERGNGVIVDHGLGVFSGYFHLSRILAQTGQTVAPGETIGLAGSTGLSTGPHVHWEIVVNGINIDALQFAQTTLP
jgi:murein DD-endopeptidase MepM/ murein hydrolase activator NlpD